MSLILLAFLLNSLTYILAGTSLLERPALFIPAANDLVEQKRS